MMTAPLLEPPMRGDCLMRTFLVCMLLACLAGCATALPQVERVPTKSLKADPSSVLGAAAHDAMLAPGLSGFRPMPQGAIALDARLALIENAQVSVDLQTYLLGNDATGRLILRSLRDAALRGVRVRLLLDDFYTSGMDRLLLGLQAYPNVEIRLFNPFVSGRNGSLPRMVAFAGSFERLNHRMHNKLLTADAVMAIAGGRNTADEYFFRGAQSNFVDFDLLITGELVNHLGELFDMYWNSEQVFPIVSVAKTSATKEDLRRAFDASVGGPDTPRPPLPEPDLYGKAPVSVTLAQHQMEFVAALASAHADSPLKASPTQSGSEEASDTVRRRAMALLPTTKSELIMFSPYFIPGEPGLEEFRALRERGVRIRIITNSLPTNDEPLVSVGYAAYRVPLLQMGAELFELSSTRLGHIPFMQRVLGQSKGQLHAKMGFIDREVVLIGSMNMDPRSANLNTELGVLVRSPELAKMILDVYKIDHLEGVYQVKLKPDGKTVTWSYQGADGEETVDQEPDLDTWARVRLYFQYLFVSDELL